MHRARERAKLAQEKAEAAAQELRIVAAERERDGGLAAGERRAFPLRRRDCKRPDL